jgi:CxxC-x17-CxxC domain-containing protein
MPRVTRHKSERETGYYEWISLKRIGESIGRRAKKGNFCAKKYEELNSITYRKETHKAVCAECGKECEVPFKPDGSRPVYCRECYAKRRPPRRY